MTPIRTKNHAANSANTIGQRLKFEMKSRGVTSTELAKRTDVKTSFIYDVISGKSANPSTVKLARVAEGLGITLASLLAPEDRMEPSNGSKLSGNDYVMIPYLCVDAPDARPAQGSGQPFCFLNSWVSHTLESDIADLRVFSINGDNMEPTLAHNDIVLVDIAMRNPSSPGIYVISDGYGISVKRLERVNASRIRVVSDNPQYAIYESSPATAGIIGRVVWFSRGI